MTLCRPAAKPVFSELAGPSSAGRPRPVRSRQNAHNTRTLRCANFLRRDKPHSILMPPCFPQLQSVRRCKPFQFPSDRLSARLVVISNGLVRAAIFLGRRNRIPEPPPFPSRNATPLKTRLYKALPFAMRNWGVCFAATFFFINFLDRLSRRAAARASYRSSLSNSGSARRMALAVRSGSEKHLATGSTQTNRFDVSHRLVQPDDLLIN